MQTVVYGVKSDTSPPISEVTANCDGSREINDMVAVICEHRKWCLNNKAGKFDSQVLYYESSDYKELISLMHFMTKKDTQGYLH